MSTPSPRFPRRERHIYRIKKVLEATGFSRAWLYVLIARGEFPKARKIGLRAVGWPSDEVIQWVNDRLEGRV
ncbi:Prophage CP4-57 regulatory protein (AlpA) [compost metagenome]